MRLFLSIDLPDAVASALVDVQDRLRDADGLRFVDPGRAHVTLKFLGDASEGRVPAIEAAVERAIDDAGVGPFEATIGGLGVFPNEEYISVVWAGIEEGADEMTRLHEAIERETTAVGFDAEPHDFTPHVTIARMDDARGKDLVRRVVREGGPTLETFRVEEIRLKESVLASDGPEYSTVARFGL
ncbi:RNA 2',3'-cyclic phosphodiesterase [Halegenticoccus tardaugens]|uniref:RNA 2',3'-cyclic phosphodiesterase n=1 Tax=Halegenticoccus tardaugens TaxID=2071624 RepID=UPI00100AFCE5|nr:RNA 2',3'-cyclic phosphodiesterase [Halegenticoccus tardaugens]